MGFLTLIKCDYEAAYIKSFRWRGFVGRLFSDPNLRVVVRFRLSVAIKDIKIVGSPISFFLWRRNIFKSGCHLHVNANIDQSIVLAHAVGVVIGEGVVIGKNVTIFQHVTIGAHGIREFKYPVIGENVVIYAGACVIGDISIGANSVVAANAVVTKSVPKCSLVAGVPAKIIKTFE